MKSGSTPYLSWTPRSRTGSSRRPTSEASRRARPDASYNALRMSLPPNITRHVLPSGLTILIETLPYVRSVSLGYYLRSGSAVESEEHSGSSHFLEHLVFKGTERRTTSDIAQVVDILGGDVDAFTGKEYTSFYA